MKIRCRWVLAAVLATAAAHGQNAPLFAIPTQSAAVGAIPADQPLRIALYASDLPELARTLGVETPPAEAERIEYTFGDYPQLSVESQRSWLESSFVVDYSEPELVGLYAELVKAKGGDPSRELIVEFVAATVEGMIGRGWDIASTVARNRKGDCTEFAVITAALARAANLPARVVLGLVVVYEPEQGYTTYGHAWAEVKEGDRWIVADAALRNVQATVRYVPYGVLTNEGPGFMLGLGGLMNRWVQRVVVLAPAHQDRTSDGRP